MINADARVGDTVSDIYDKVSDKSDENIEHLKQKHDFKILVVQRLNIELADAVESENILDHNGAGEYAEEPAYNKSYYGDQRVSPRMAVNDCFLAQTFRPRGSDAVERKSLRHGSADITGHTAQGCESHRDQRQTHIIKFVKKRAGAGIVSAGGSHTGNGEPAEDRCKDPDEDYAYDKRRNTVTDYRCDLNCRVALASAVNCAEDTERDRDPESENGCENIDENGVFHRFDYNVFCVSRILIAVTEITLKDPVVLPVDGHDAYPAEVTDENVPVGSEFVSLLFDKLFKFRSAVYHMLVRVLLLFCLGASSVERDHCINKIHQQREYQHDNEHITESFKYIFAHTQLP